MGYVLETRQLAARHDRCRNDWRPHLQATRSLILEAARCCSRSERVVVVGSGLLFDIPLAELCQHFREVLLVDILHPWQVRKTVLAHPNATVLDLDVTGVVRDVHDAARYRWGLEVSVEKPDFLLDERFDLVVSANILSQLAVLPNGYATRRMREPSAGMVRDFSRRLVIAHLDWLASFEGVVCLVSDLERLFCDGDLIVDREDSLWGVELPDGGREWIWDLAPRPEIDWNRDICHRVVGYREFPKTAWRAARAHSFTE